MFPGRSRRAPTAAGGSGHRLTPKILDLLAFLISDGGEFETLTAVAGEIGNPLLNGLRLLRHQLGEARIGAEVGELRLGIDLVDVLVAFLHGLAEVL